MTTVAHCIHGLDLGGAQQILKTLVQGRNGRDFRYVVYDLRGQAVVVAKDLLVPFLADVAPGELAVTDAPNP